ncbi:hypothetical protein TU81_03900 [Pseudomonas lini]|nr:hypothetical protein TU81_03900 [Pseudomonas lini]
MRGRLQVENSYATAKQRVVFQIVERGAQLRKGFQEDRLAPFIRSLQSVKSRNTFEDAIHNDESNISQKPRHFRSTDIGRLDHIAHYADPPRKVFGVLESMQ